ncbi:MAG: hypothetical protein IJ583_07260 [Firmicutes bacterium]|nr:hypothetical protein [Bacillota bacterium]
MKNVDVIQEKAKAILTSNACPELKEAAEKYLNDKDNKKALDELIATAKASRMKIDDVIAFFKSEGGIEKLGAETAANIVAHGEEIKAKGAVYCDCPACTLAREISE